ncbi:MAG TPA: flagellar basal body-associated FliL family protein [Ignavibacteriaceae bacterium]|nr:flagellar basal body-associated FliL family protein [Ignavibacteriaceae bacterium]
MKFGKKKNKQDQSATADNQSKEGSGKELPDNQQPAPKQVQKEPDAAPEAAQEIEKPKTSKSGPLNMKVFLIGLPLFIIQVAAVYFITANILMSKSASQRPKDNETTAEASTDSLAHLELGKHVFLIEDIIVNPSGSDGDRLLLTSLGLDTKDEESQKELKAKEVVVKDIIITTFSSKTWEQLNKSNFKDTLKMELSEKIRRLIPSIKLNTVYFSKYIAQ